MHCIAFHSEHGEDADSEMRFGNQGEKERISSSQVNYCRWQIKASPAATLEFGLGRIGAAGMCTSTHQPHTAIGSLASKSTVHGSSFALH
jgi:hypothetical protein